ncbi:DUF3426 domain-containing protein [Geomonas propionica]|uniref:Zinc-ribbon domain-containing protein n=1 Tax=Geomonas propionica TaxID=2798582 RepID=A0ABS0YTT7_9BACT|nr:DUF3426 domain-containing protein [Geomonas propionica]MBJ6801390.1 zinc-ribbon domain-containing protein [Geomonas propionica]
MILQCDQCNTKFRLDDSKLKPGGVKVRCSKCRHVFVAGAEQKAEESDFDALLSGLGAQAPAQAEQEPTAAQADQETPSPKFGVDASQPQQNDLAEFGFEPEPEPAPASKPGVAAAGAAAAGADDIDFGDINIETGMPAGHETPAPADTGFGEIEFNEEPVNPAPNAPTAAAPDLDFGELSFDDSPAPTAEPAPAAADSALDFGDLSFDEPAAAGKQEEAATPIPDAMAFGELTFEETAPAAKEEATAAAQSAEDAFDFGEFSFEETSAPAEESPSEAPAAAADFGEFSFDETPSAAKEQTAPAEETPEYGDFSFDEPAAAPKEEPAPAAGADSFDFGDFSFEEPAPPAQEEPAGPEAGSFSFEDDAVSEAAGEGAAETAAFGQGDEQGEGPAPARDEEFSFGDFSFADAPKAQPEAEPKDEAEGAVPAAVAAAGLAGAVAAVDAVRDEEEVAMPGATAEPKPAAKSSLDFSFGDKSFAAAVPEEGFEEELPPLSISSRRKGRSVLTIAIVAICVVVVLALSGAGLYLLQRGPEAMKKLDQYGIGFVAKWFGMEAPEEGRITIKNALASFHQNKEAGELFVVNGEAVNSYRKSRASIQVKVSIFDKAGKVLLQKTAYCGNRLSAEQLSTLPFTKIESIMNNQFGDSLSNLGVKPDQSIGFVVAIANVPKEAADFGVEVVGSTVAAGQ